MSFSYTVGEHFEHFIRQQIESGRYASASEVIREALQALEGRERLREIEIKECHAKIHEGVDSPARPAEDVFARLEAKYQAMLNPQA